MHPPKPGANFTLLSHQSKVLEKEIKHYRKMHMLD
jgi:hypothetical protein